MVSKLAAPNEPYSVYSAVSFKKKKKLNLWPGPAKSIGYRDAQESAFNAGGGVGMAGATEVEDERVNQLDFYMKATERSEMVESSNALVAPVLHYYYIRPPLNRVSFYHHFLTTRGTSKNDWKSPLCAR